MKRENSLRAENEVTRKNMKQEQKTILLQILIGFVMGRIAIFGGNPFGLAYLVASYETGVSMWPLAIVIFLGMCTTLKTDVLVVYGGAMVCLLVILDCLKRRKIYVSGNVCVFLLATAQVILRLTRQSLLPVDEYGAAYAILEGVLIVANGFVYREGIRYILSGKWTRPSIDTWISFAFLGASFILGIPRKLLGNMNLTEWGFSLVLLSFGFFMGLRGEKREKSDQLKNIMKQKLQAFSESFGELAKTMASREEKQFLPSRREMRELMDQICTSLCERCEHREQCMGQIELARADFCGTLTEAYENQGIEIEHMPKGFLRECIHLEQFISETNQNLHMARVMLGVHNKMSENRRVMAGQMREVGNLVQDLAMEIDDFEDIPQDAEGKIAKGLMGKRIKSTGIMLYEKRDGRLELHMRAKTLRGRVVTAKEIGKVLQKVLGKHMAVAPGSRQIVSQDMNYFVFEEITPFVSVTGVARRVKDGEEISGDVFSCLPLSCGETLIALSDGMGSGNAAFEDSSAVMELLEQMGEAGFSQTSSLKLINSLYLTAEESEHFATMDMLLLNLFQGTCQFMKNGATATYLYHQGEMQEIQGQALPLGAGQEVEPYLEKSHIAPGDYVIMMTDGVSDCLGYRGAQFEEFLRQRKSFSPQELADSIVEEAILQCGGMVPDDMSVIVTKIEER